MLETHLVVPGLVVAFMVAGAGGWRRRLAHLIAGGVVMVLVTLTTSHLATGVCRACSPGSYMWSFGLP